MFVRKRPLILHKCRIFYSKFFFNLKIGLETLNFVEKEQQRREREIKKQQRQMEHVQQLEQKRRLIEQKKVESPQYLASKAF
jgi:uncharacterized protein YjcR